ncbi:sulfite exporter TauE/SafE family protein [Sagittula sp. S175]|uniref:sulfite exporter TauE/SafE family protein n=1 Tax=Sagittula sp. S175 TaxID=3415129 RepID=UPI003C7E4B4D
MSVELLTWSVLAFVVPAVIFAGISKGGFGSGVAFASSSILALVLPPAVAVGLMLPLLMLMDVTSLWAYWKKWDWGVSKVLLIGSVPGTIIGALFWASANPDMIRFLIGAVALLFVAWQGARALNWIKLGAQIGPTGGVISGVVLGFTSFVSHAGGPAAAVYMLGQGMSKTSYQATTVLVFWAVNFFKAFFYAFMGIFTYDTLLLDLVLIPFAIAGTWMGIKAHHMLPEKWFFGITYVALTITGAKLMWDALF